jgi:hypothetical protein
LSGLYFIQSDYFSGGWSSRWAWEIESRESSTEEHARRAQSELQHIADAFDEFDARKEGRGL